MIRESLVVGIREIALSHQLQLDPGLTLDKAKKQIWQREALDEQQKQPKEAFGGTINLEELHTRKQPRGKEPNLLKSRGSKRKLQITKCTLYAGRVRIVETNVPR